MIIVDGAYGPIEMQVPAVKIAAAAGARSLVLIDSVALHQVERRLTARIANIARAEAAALQSNAAPPIMNPRHLVEPIKPGLLGAIPFSADSLTPTAVGLERIVAVARLAEQLSGSLEIVVITQGTGAAVFDVAVSRARRVYSSLLESAPSLRDREVRLIVRTSAVNPGAPRASPVVEVYSVSVE